MREKLNFNVFAFLKMLRGKGGNSSLKQFFYYFLLFVKRMILLDYIFFFIFERVSFFYYSSSKKRFLFEKMKPNISNIFFFMRIFFLVLKSFSRFQKKKILSSFLKTFGKKENISSTIPLQLLFQTQSFSLLPFL